MQGKVRGRVRGELLWRGADGDGRGAHSFMAPPRAFATDASAQYSSVVALQRGASISLSWKCEVATCTACRGVSGAYHQAG